MQIKNSLFLLSAALVVSLLFPPAGIAENRKKVLVLLADWGKSGVPADAAAVMTQYPELKLAVAWPSGAKVSEAVRPLVREGRIEPALVLADEPVFPLVYATVISTEPALSFSWPGDLWRIVVRGQEEMKASVPAGSAGLFLRSESFSTDLVDGLRNLGISWADYRDRDDRQGAFLKDGFLLLAVQKDDIRGFDELQNLIEQSSAPVVVARFSDSNPVSAPLLAVLGERLRQDPALVMATPSQLLKHGKELVSPADTAQSDTSPWMRRPALLYKLSVARNAIEEYKNSGQAQPRTLEALESEIYNLYRFDFLARMNDNPQPEDEQLFLVGLRNIYMLLKRPLPAEIAGVNEALPSTGSDSELSVNISTSSITYANALSADRPAGIRELTVSADGETVVYSIALASGLPAQVAVDVYMDLNNQRGAGLTGLLNGAGFLEPQDAWEFAFRIENGQVSLYRSGRFTPTLIKKFPAAAPLAVEIPRSILRGNPLRWGYQAVLLEQNDGTWRVDDFLCQDEGARRRILEQKPLQLPMVRERLPQ